MSAERWALELLVAQVLVPVAVGPSSAQGFVEHSVHQAQKELLEPKPENLALNQPQREFLEPKPENLALMPLPSASLLADQLHG